jgi:L-gulonate 3-dehydrogenase
MLAVPSKISEELVNRERFIVAHPCNPPYHTPMVELVPAPWTSQPTQLAARSIMQEVGQGPVSLSR